MEVVVLLGAPGSGKGTVASRLAPRLGGRHVSSGDLLRAAIASGSEEGRTADSFISRGALVPDEVVGRVVAGQLAPGDGARGLLLLDGYPRTVAQAARLETDLARLGARLRAVVQLEAADELLVERLSGRRVCPACGAVYHVRTLPPRAPDACDACGARLARRSDDDPATVRRRLETYRRQTAPVADWYTARGLLRAVDGSGPADEVVARVAGVLAP